MTNTTRRAGLGADAQQLGLHVLAGHLVEGAERLVHQQQRRVGGERPGDGDPLLHAARQLPRPVVGEVAELDELEHLERPLAPLGLVPALQLERQLDVLGDACASRTGRPAGTPCRSPGRGGPGAAGLPLTMTSPVVGSMRLAMSRSSVDLPQPDGPISDTNSPGATVRSMSTSASTWFGRARVEDLADASSTTTALASAPPPHVLLRAVAHQHDARATATRPAIARPSSGRAEEGGVHLGRVRRGLAGVLEDQPADAAAQPGRDLGHDDADHRRRRRPAERRHEERHGGREAQLAQRLPRPWRRSCASARATAAGADSSPRSAPTATGKKARNAPSTDDRHPPRPLPAAELQLAAPADDERGEGDQRHGLGHDEVRQQAALDDPEARPSATASPRPTTTPSSEAGERRAGTCTTRRASTTCQIVAVGRRGARVVESADASSHTWGIAVSLARGRIAQPSSSPPSSGPIAL